jgi:hypothetical protein
VFAEVALRLTCILVFALAIAGCRQLAPYGQSPDDTLDACCAALDAGLDSGSVDVTDSGSVDQVVLEASMVDAGNAEAAASFDAGDDASPVDASSADLPADAGLIPGDLDGDGKVDQGDYSLFQAAFGRCKGEAGYLAAADYDGDDCITLVDYQLWYALYKQTLQDGGVG